MEMEKGGRTRAVGLFFKPINPNGSLDMINK
jgi:hypothetical protein